MATTSIHLSLSESTGAHLQDAMEFRAHSSPSAYITSLIERDHAEQMRFIEAKLNETIGQESIEITEEEWMSDDLIEIMEAKLDQRKHSQPR